MICKLTPLTFLHLLFYKTFTQYFRSKKECVAIDAREAAPSAAHQRMFVDGNPPPSPVSGKSMKKTESMSITLCINFIE